MVATCPYCRGTFEPEDETVSCSGCNAIHHAPCFEENGGCTVFGCSQAPVDEPKINITRQDLTTPAPIPEPPTPQFSNPNSIFNLNARTPSTVAAPVTVAPPPRPESSGSTPPPPPGPPGPQPYQRPLFSGYGAPIIPPPNVYVPRRSRVVYVLLAVFLGAFGGHNFYAGYIKKAVIQLCLTVLTCFFGSIISWIWAIVEACIIDQDYDGVAFV
jgi:TM2 domain-containing membrane protein YozV